MLVSQQTICKILNTKDFDFIVDNAIDSSYFIGCEKEFEFIKDHYNRYKSIPDVETFKSKFNNFDIIEVSEPDTYLLNKLREEHLAQTTIPIVKKTAELYKEDANKAVEYILSNLNNVQINYGIEGIDIIKNAEERLLELKDKQKNKDNWYFSFGLEELDELLGGIQRGEELITFFARPGIGKSWTLEKIAIAIWEQGGNVGFFSPEMAANTVGFRFDTLYKHFSNTSLSNAKSISGYEKYIKELSKNKTKFLVTSPIDFGKQATVSKLRSWIKSNKLDALIVDGIKYLSDERYKRGDNATTSLTNISEDLMTLSNELKIPVLVAIQSNRGGADQEKESPELENIRDSDGCAHNSTRVIAITNRDSIIGFHIKKNRYGQVGNKLLYNVDIDTGTYTYLPNDKSGLVSDELKVIENASKYVEDSGDVF